MVGRESRAAPRRLLQRQAEMHEVPQRPVHGQHAAGERAVGEANRVVLFEDAMLAEAIFAGRHSRRGDRIGDAVEIGDRAQRHARGALLHMDEVEDQLGPFAVGECGADRAGAAVMQAAHGVEQMGEARGARSECRRGLRIAARRVADLDPRPARKEMPQQRPVGIDLGRHGGDADG